VTQHSTSSAAKGSAQGQKTFEGAANGIAPVTVSSLLESARRHGTRGLRARSDQEHDYAALHLGIMIEHLAKAYLVSFNPALLAEEKADFLTMVRLCGHGARVKVGLPPRTVGLEVALARVGQLNENVGDVRGLPELLRPVAQARNGVAHVGDPGGDADAIAQLAMRGAKVLLSLLQQDMDAFFGDWDEAAESLLDERASAVHQRVESKKARARERFETRWAAVPVERRHEQFELILTQEYIDEDDDRQPYRCPACAQTGTLIGQSNFNFDVDAEFVDGEQQVISEVSEICLTPETFECPFCGLSLSGREELVDAELPERVKVRDATDEDLADYASIIWEEYERSGDA